MFSIIKTPTGRFVFVGKVPEALAIETDRPDLARAAKQCGIGFAKRIAEREGGYIRTRAWATAEEARAEALRLGFTAAEG